MLLTETRPYHLLVLCTGNSARSIMGEALFNEIGKGVFTAESAGSHPTGRVHPLALAEIKKFGLGTEKFSSKNVNQFMNEKNQPFDFIIAVCDNAAEACPVLPNAPHMIHWSFPDPAAFANEAEAKIAFSEVFEELKNRIKTLIAHKKQHRSLQQLSENLTRLGTPYQLKMRN